MTARVAVVIPTFNRANEIDKTLTELRKQTYKNFTIVIVDNSSEDNTKDIITTHKSFWADKLLYHVKPPNGPASARNKGLELVSCEFVLFLDSDVSLHCCWIEQAVNFLEKNSMVAAVSGVVLYGFDDEQVNAYGGEIGLLGLAWDSCEATNKANISKAQQRIWANCSAMLSRRSCCQQVDGFDERFFYGYEDSDLGWKFNVVGYQVWVLPDLFAYHDVLPDQGSANEQIVFHYCKNRLRSLLKNSSPLGLCYRLPFYLLYSVIDLLLRGPRKAKIRALWWNILYLKETLFLRQKIQAKRVTSEPDIFRLSANKWFPERRLNGKRRRPVVQTGKMNVEIDNKPTWDDRI